MNRTLLGAVAALVLAAAGLFWWQGRAELERGAPPPDLGAGGPRAEAPIDLPSADPNHARGAGLPSARTSKQSKEERRFNRYDRNRDGRITRVEMLSTRVKAFQKLDTNHDNLLSFEEWAVKTSNRFREVDRNGDGIISRDELNAYYAAKDAKAAERKARCQCSPSPALGANRRGSPPPDESDDGE
ncbi:MAG: EF-hand domain-containing protein [Proteobacteria bacterium]|nr:EF-hand domain-containing protein [Pseudomonadota bacterium]